MSQRGRGAGIRPPNRFESQRLEGDPVPAPAVGEAWGDDETGPTDPRTVFLDDHSRSIISKNDSPDVGFHFSVNPYRGCEHGCAYCYARPTHEYLGMDAGLDFETKIMVKREAPKLLRAELSKPSWRPAPIAFSGVTDCYQPAERRFRLTRGCLEVLLELRHPALIITKNVLVLRDLDLLKEMARLHLIHVRLSLTTLDESLARLMEPRTPTPKARLDAISRLSAAGVPVGVLTAPLVPGLTDAEIPQLLAAAAAAGARSAGYTLLRLPHAVRPIFLDWLERHVPEKRAKILGRITDIRDGKLNEPRFGTRMEGTGAYAESIAQTFAIFARRHGLDGALTPRLDLTRFKLPAVTPHQRSLFND